MPIYQYRCKKCANLVEVMQKITDKPLKECKDCGGGLEKIISTPGIIFKGTGFHLTDYARGKRTAHKAEPPKKEISSPKENIKTDKNQVPVKDKKEK